ncbi:MAG: DNA polymerase IV [Micrococcales bacterium 73-13]|nr:MAG: DNA polymerase IV [Micrococcales bacterium 73-13]
MSRQDGRDRLVSAEDADDTGATILHADLDAFFASVELLDRPELRGRPVIVGRDSPRSVVTAATYEARRYGVNSAMPMAVALRRCPHAVVVEPHRDRYEHWSARFFEICRTITPLVEPVGIDEGFLDVSGAGRAIGSPRAAAALLRERVRERTGLVASVGVAGSKFVAKLASGRAKPDGLLVVPVAETVAFLRPLPVDALWGVGGRTGERLRGRAISTIGELADTPPATLRAALGDALAQRLHELARGIDPRPVVTERAERSIGRETTFEEDVADPAELRRVLRRLSDDVGARLRRAGCSARTIAIKVRFGDFRTISRSRTLAEPTDVGHAIHEAAVALLDAAGEIPPVRLIGVRAEQLGPRTVSLWEEDAWREAEQAVDQARDRFGRGAVRPARLLPDSGGPRGPRRPA